MPATRRFPPSWTIDEMNDPCFIVHDKNAGPRLFLFRGRAGPTGGGTQAGDLGDEF